MFRQGIKFTFQLIHNLRLFVRFKNYNPVQQVVKTLNVLFLDKVLKVFVKDFIELNCEYLLHKNIIS